MTDLGPAPIPERIGRYRIVGLLGTGGFASVFRGRDDDLHADVAVKVMASNWAAQPAMVEQFLREGRTMRRVEHPGIVAVHDLGTLDDGRPYLVMDLVPGGSIADRLGDGAAGIGAAMAVVERIAPTIEHLHASGVVHRDLTPRNLFCAGPPPADGSLLGPHETVLVGDLGLAAATGSSAVGGSAGYAAPDAVADARTDVFSLAAVVRRIAGPVTPPVAAVLDAATHQNPDRRPASVGALVVDLRGAVRAGATGQSRRRFLIGAGAVLGIGGVAAAIVQITGGGSTDRPLTAAPLGPTTLVDGTLVTVDRGTVRDARNTLRTWADLDTDGTGIAALDGLAVVALPGRHQVVAVDADGTVVVLAGTGSAGGTGDGGDPTTATLSSPTDVAVDDGVVYIADRANDRVRRIRNGIIDTVAGSTSGGDTGDGGQATDARLAGPSALTVTDDGRLIVLDTGNTRLRAVDLDTGLITTLAGTGAAGYTGDGGPPTAASFTAPSDVLAVDDRVLVADTGNGVVRVIEDDTITSIEVPNPPVRLFVDEDGVAHTIDTSGDPAALVETP